MTATKAAGVASKGAVWVLESVSDHLWDLRANLMSDIVAQHGPTRAVAWFARNMPTYEKILKAWGPLRTHYLAVVISATNGCRYCTYGHAYAFALHYFEQHDRVFTLTENEMADAGAFSAQERNDLLTDALVQAGLDAEVAWVERTLLLLDDPQTEALDRDDEWIRHLISMFAWLNACGIAAQTEPDAAHDPINKDIDLRDRYQAATEA